MNEKHIRPFNPNTTPFNDLDDRSNTNLSLHIKQILSEELLYELYARTMNEIIENVSP